MYLYLDYKDVFLEPQYSEVTSRKQVDVSCTMPDNSILSVPVISANMDTVTEDAMARAMQRGGGAGALHRFMTIERNVDVFKLSEMTSWVSIGVNEESKTRARALYESGARRFVVDVAHGHSILMKNMVAWLREEYKDTILIMAGNVATVDGVRDLTLWGADIVKVGIGPGNVCLTKNVTGVTVPQFSAVNLCAKGASALYAAKLIPKKPLIVADGGITEFGDIAKALAAGADLVMSGKLFASCREAPGERIEGKKVYRGMASRDAMLTIRSSDSLPTAEGMSTLIDSSEHSAEEVCQQIKGALQSAFSYSNSLNMKEFHERAKWHVRHTQMK